jgi:hypothetical protein
MAIWTLHVIETEHLRLHSLPDAFPQVESKLATDLKTDLTQTKQDRKPLVSSSFVVVSI